MAKISNVIRNFIGFFYGVSGLIMTGAEEDPDGLDEEALLFYRSDTKKLRLQDDTGVFDNIATEGYVASQVPSDANLASHVNGEGASLVGIEDASSLIAATTVEGALTELTKKANAGLAVPVCIPVVLVRHANGSIAARFTPGYAGKIRKITASVTDPATTSNKLATFTPAIATTPTTGGALALTSANCTPVGAKVDGSAITALNAFAATDEITIVASSVTAFVEGQVVIYLFLDPAA